MKDKLQSLMIVEDNPSDMMHYLRLLEEVDHRFEKIECCTTLKGAYESLNHISPIACCILDFNLPDGSALSLVENLKKEHSELSCPIIVITGQTDTKKAVELLKMGVQDYVVKDDLTSNILIRTIENAIQNWELKKQLEHMAMYDSLTSLANRGLFVDKLEHVYNEAARYGHEFSLMLLDLDKFKAINDIYGHEAGDDVLRFVGHTLQNVLRDSDIAGRLGGDEFGVILPETSGDATYSVADKILKSLSVDIDWRNSVIPLSPSIGITVFPSRAKNCKDLVREADIALYKAKENGRGKFECYRQGWKEQSSEKSRLRNYLPEAISTGAIKLAMQPIYATDGDQQTLCAIEALTRLKLDDRWINPITVVDMVMELGLDIEFHRWLFSEAFLQLSQCQKMHPQLKLNINLPANICHSPRVSDLLIDTAKKYGIASSDVILEVTETHLMINPDKAKHCLTELVEKGFSIAIDDFGTGYSSMEYIAELPCSYLKIDKKFFLDLPSNNRNRNIIEAIIGLAHGLEMKIIAEGIESKELVDEATSLNCDFLQGFHLAKPSLDFRDYI